MAAENELRLSIRMTNQQAFSRLNQMQQRVGTTGQRAFGKMGAEARNAARAVQDVGRFGQFAFEVLQAFLLYKGFVFLKQQAEEFIGSLVEMQDQVQQTRALMQDMGGEISSILQRQVLETARETGVEMERLAEAQFNVISANVELADSMEVLNSTAKAVVAGGLEDAQTAFEAGISQVNAFGIAMNEFDEVMDKQFNALRRGIFTYEQFAGVVGQVSNAFGQMGQSVEVANAALAAVSQIFTGKQLRRGATGLRNAVIEMRENTEVFEEFGIQMTDAQGNFRNFVDIINDLKEALSGLSEVERAEAIEQLFERRRAQRGVQALLRQTEELNQFFVEQQFALNDLDEAYETVTESIQRQAQMMKQELIPAIKPMVRLGEDLLETLNALGDATGGFENLAILLGAAGGGFFASRALRGAGLGGGFQRGTRMQGLARPMMGGTARQISASGFTTPPMAPAIRQRQVMTGAFGRGIVTRGNLARGGAIGMGGLLSFQRAQAPGDLGVSGAISNIAGPTIMGGMVGGLPGAAAGAGVGGIATLLGEHFEEEAPDVADSFTDRFSDALQERVDETGQSFAESAAQAFDEALQEQRGGLTGPQRIVQALEPQTVEVRETIRRPSGQQGPIPGVAGGGGVLLNLLGIGGNNQAGLRTQVRTETQLPGLTQLVQQGDISEVIRTTQQMQKRARGIPAPMRERFGIDVAETRQATIEQGIEQFIPDELVEENQAAADALRSFIDIMVENELSLEQQRQALEVLQDTSMSARERLQAFMEEVRNATSNVNAFGRITAQIQASVEGELDPAISIFGRLGDEGQNLAETFKELQGTMERFEQFQSFLDMTLRTRTRTQRVQTGTRTVGPRELANLSPQQRAQAQQTGSVPITGPFGQQLGQAPQFQVPTFGTETTRQEFTGLDVLNEVLPSDVEEFTKEEIGSAFQADIGDTIEDILGSKLEDASREEILNAIVRGEAADDQAFDPEVVPEMTDLADQVAEARDLVRDDLIPSFGFTANELDGLAQTFEDFNRQIFRIGIVEEVQRLGEVAGFNAERLDPVLQSMVEDIDLAGQSFREVFESPEKLADLLAEVEFGDVQVDQSQNNNFVIRISGGTDLDTDRAARLGDRIAQRINNQTRQSMSR